MYVYTNVHIYIYIIYSLGGSRRRKSGGNNFNCTAYSCKYRATRRFLCSPGPWVSLLHGLRVSVLPRLGFKSFEVNV